MSKYDVIMFIKNLCVSNNNKKVQKSLKKLEKQKKLEKLGIFLQLYVKLFFND